MKIDDKVPDQNSKLLILLMIIEGGVLIFSLSNFFCILENDLPIIDENLKKTQYQRRF